MVTFAHEMVARVLAAGDTAVDATVGNGHDTCALAERVGPEGRVYGFDIQTEAIHAAAQRLDVAGVLRRVVLVEQGHESLGEWFHDHAPNVRPRAVMFNLGYLPGGDRARSTQPETTLRALDAALDLLAPAGVVTVVLYPGHFGGRAEADAVLAWCRSLSEDRAQAACYQRLNGEDDGPIVVAVVRR